MNCELHELEDCLSRHAPDGRFIVVVYEEVDDETVLPVTAYEVPEP